MGILEDAIYNAKTAAGFVGKKAEKFVDISKLTISAAELSSEISKKCEILGRVVYEAKTSDKCYDKAIAELVEKISDLKGQLDSVNELIAETKNRAKCPKCSTVNSRDAIFCGKCGERLRNSEVMPQPDEVEEPKETEKNTVETSFADAVSQNCAIPPDLCKVCPNISQPPDRSDPP